MLQKIHDSVGRWVAGIILGLLAIAFVFWGVDFTGMGSSFAAKVNGEEIPLAEFERALQAEQNQYQQLYRTELTDDMRRLLRRNLIEQMVANEALEQRVVESGYRVSDERLTDYIRGMAAFQIDGNFSLALYNTRLRNEGLSPAAFEEVQRRQLEMVDLQRGVASSTFLTPAEFRRHIELFNQRREASFALFEPESFLEGIEITDEDVAAFYESNRDRYMSEETVDIEYVEILQSEVAGNVEVTEEDLRAYYDEQRERFVAEEERHARHILLTGDTTAAEATATELVERLEAGEDFAALAQEFSQDPGTSGQGGDLGWIGRGMLGDAFEDALYDMQVGEVRGPVLSEFGVHVIKLEEVREGQVQSFEAMADELREEFSTRQAEEIFYTRANELADAAFDAIDSLEGVAAELGLPLQRREGLPRTGDPLLFPNSAPVVQAAFDELAVERQENSDLIELADDHVLVLRVTGHHPAELQPLDVVRERVAEELRFSRAQEQARDAAAAFLAAVEADPTLPAATAPAAADADSGAAADGDAAAAAAADVGAAVQPRPDDASNADSEAAEDADAALSPIAALAASHGGTWHERTALERTAANVPSEVLTTLFAMPPPAADAARIERVSLASGDEAVLLLHAVRAGEPESIPRDAREQRRLQLADQAAIAELAAYVGNVRDAATVRVPQEILEPPAF